MSAKLVAVFHWAPQFQLSFHSFANVCEITFAKLIHHGALCKRSRHISHPPTRKKTDSFMYAVSEHFDGLKCLRYSVYLIVCWELMGPTDLLSRAQKIIQCSFIWRISSFVRESHAYHHNWYSPTFPKCSSHLEVLRFQKWNIRRCTTCEGNQMSSEFWCLMGKLCWNQWESSCAPKPRYGSWIYWRNGGSF